MNLTPEAVERRIEEAGRVAVFDRARELGWSNSLPPLWVWNQIALEVIAGSSHREEGMSKPGRGAPGVPRKRTGEIKTSISVVYEAFKHIRCSDMLVSEIARQAGVTPESMRRWRLGIASPNIADFEAVLNVLGYELKLSPLDDAD